MTSEGNYPTANGKRFTLDVDTQADVPPYQDWAHTDRLDNFTVMEVAGKSRCHGMQLEGHGLPDHTDRDALPADPLRHPRDR